MGSKRVVVGMSGGVDSSVAAWLLKKEGYEVFGVTMQVWRYSPPGGGEPRDLPAADDAREVARLLDIPHKVVSVRERFGEIVVDEFVGEYIRGRTPNPCVICNRLVKWETLLERAREVGAEYVATGHYARAVRLSNGRFALRRATDGSRDQTYALYGLTQAQLSRTLMPVGEYSKPEIRRIAEQAGLPVAHKHDSQEICFIPDNDYPGFILGRCPQAAAAGDFVDESGAVVGHHEGVYRYTIGQRRGLRLAVGRPVYVTELRPETHQVVVGPDESLYSSRLICERLFWMGLDGLNGEERRVTAKIRYSHPGASCVIREAEGGRVEAHFDDPQRAITPGQAVVFYDGDVLLGGGTIVSA